MSDALPLPPRPHLDYYRTASRDLQDAAQDGTVSTWAARFISALAARTAIERYGHRQDEAAIADRVVQRWQAFVTEHVMSRAVRLSDAQFFVARLHGFASWTRFTHHVQTMAGDSLTAAFEAAADAIVAGETERLRQFLDAHRDLVRARSTRDHRSTLLHYVSANGVEDFRQKTPANVVTIAALLLDRGADVNAESEAYGGHSTTLGLAATSVHPEQAGVQIPLLELLLARGADIDQRDHAGNRHSIVGGCLANGQGRAARFLADRGAALDLEAAAGVGRVDVLATFVARDGTLTNGATPAQFDSGFMYAAGYGQDHAVRFLLARGANPNMRYGGATPLHWATYGPHVGTATQLLDAGAAVDARDDRFHATPLDWALYHWVHGYDAAGREHGTALITCLMAAGATPDLGRFDERTFAALTGDPRLMAALERRGVARPDADA